MIAYLILPILIIIFCKQINKKKFNFFDFIILFLLINICGLRYQVGTDYNLYSLIFYNIEKFPRIEFFFTKVIELFNLWNLSVHHFFYFIATITLIYIYYSIKKYSKKPAESLFLFVCLGFYALQFNIIRQMLAVSITFFASKYIIEKKFFKYIICIILASLCHTTAIIMLPFYFISHIKLDRKKLLSIMAIMFAASFLYIPLLNFIIGLLPTYGVYLNINSFTYDSAGYGTYLNLITYLLLFGLILINQKELIKLDSNNKNYINLSVFSFFFYFLSLTNTVMVRPAYYFSIYFILLLPDLYKIARIKNKEKSAILIIIVFIIYYVLHLIFFNSMIPYKTII